MFRDIFGRNPRTKILDFLADYPRFDYSITEISDKAEVSRPTTYKVIAALVEDKLVVKTREQGNSSLYQLNLENDLVRALLKFDFEMASQNAVDEGTAPLKYSRPAYVAKRKAVAKS
jgi:DNA-binding transcriptional ArsR family regulator